MKEIFKDIPNYEGHYKVSNLGCVKSFKFSKERILKYGIYRRRKYYRLILDGKTKKYYAHQLVAMAFLGHKPCGMKIVVDHINNDRTDDRLENLQLISTRENNSKDKKNGTSKYTGVFWDKQNNKWMAQIGIGGKRKFLGYFINELKAAKAYQNALNSL